MSEDDKPETEDKGSSDSLSSRLRDARDHQALSRAALAEASGISTPTIFRLERGDYDDGTIQIKVMVLLAGALNVSPAWLALGTRTERPPWVRAKDRRRS